MQLINTGVFLTLLLVTANTLPRKPREHLQEFMGHGTNELTIAVLQGYVEKDSNLAFSPLGYSTLLAVLAEGARGETKNQLVSALHLPESQQLTRESYKNVLEGLRRKGEPPVNVPVDQETSSNKDGKDVPEFRNWFYIYKNFSVDSDYKDILLNNYLTEIRNVERLMDDDLPEMSDSDSNNEMSMEDGPKQSESLGQNEPAAQNEETKKVNTSFIKDTAVPVMNEDSVLDKDTGNGKGNIKEETEKDELINEVAETTTNTGEILNNMSNNDESPTKLLPEVGTDTLKLQQSESEKVEISSGETGIKHQAPLKDDRISASELSKPNDEVKKVKDEEAMNIAAALMEEALQNHAIREDAMIESILKEQENPKSELGMGTTENMNSESQTQSIDSETKILDTEKLEASNINEENSNVMELHKEPIEIQTEKSDQNDAVTVQSVKEESAEDVQLTKLQQEGTNGKSDEAKPSQIEELKEKEANSANENMTENVKEECKLEHEKQKDEKGGVAFSELKEPEEKNKTYNNEKIDVINEKDEMMLAIERSKKMTDMLLHKNDMHEARGITSGISGNRIVQKSSQKPDSVMIIFNALYYKGTWETPLTKQPSDLPDVFYKSDSEKINTPFLHSIGTYKVGAVPDLDSVAIELPYKGGRYSLLVILPNQRNGLRSLIADQLTSDCLKNIATHLSRKEVQVCIPKFQVETVTKPVESLKKFGITDIFSQEKADLSGLSRERGLYVDDVAQFVTINVDRDGSAANYLTSSSILPASTRNGEYEKFVADHPFLFFVRDNSQNVVVVAGKVTDPTTKSMR